MSLLDCQGKGTGREERFHNAQLTYTAKLCIHYNGPLQLASLAQKEMSLTQLSIGKRIILFSLEIVLPPLHPLMVAAVEDPNDPS